MKKKTWRGREPSVAPIKLVELAAASSTPRDLFQIELDTY